MPFRRNFTGTLVLVTALGAMVGACGSESTGTDATVTAGTTATATGTPPERPMTAEIDQDNLAFEPSSVTIAAGGQITFKNSETAIHTVTINGKNESGTMKKGDVFLWSPPAAGTYKITCDFHPQMRATVKVE
jgi:plastocyanin